MLTTRLGDKIDRVRGGAAPLAPSWRPTQQPLTSGRDPWVRRLIIGGLAVLGLTLVLFIIYAIVLHSGITG
jgi:hypothetical protein